MTVLLDDSLSEAEQQAFRICQDDTSILGWEVFDPRPPALERRELAQLLRNVAGNPFRPFEPRLRTETVTALARQIQEGNEALLPILADALEDAGCRDEDMLLAGRGGVPGDRGSWVADLILEDALQGDLPNPDARVRQGIARALEAAPPEARADMEKLVTEFEERFPCAEIFEQIFDSLPLDGKSAAVPLLMAFVNDHFSELTRARAAGCLGPIGSARGCRGAGSYEGTARLRRESSPGGRVGLGGRCRSRRKGSLAGQVCRRR